MICPLRLLLARLEERKQGGQLGSHGTTDGIEVFLGVPHLAQQLVQLVHLVQLVQLLRLSAGPAPNALSTPSVCVGIFFFPRTDAVWAWCPGHH